MAIVSGLSGHVNQGDSVVGSVQKWSIDYNGEPVSYVASSTKQGTVRIAGNNDWTGQYTALGGLPAVMRGDLFNFEGSVDETNGVEGDVIVETVVINWDIEGGGLITHEVTFAAVGVLNLGAITSTPDNTLPPVDISSIITVALKESDALGALSFDPVLDIRTMQLTISGANPSYVSSTTAGQTQRVKGPWDWEFSYTLFEGDPANLFVPGTVKALQVFINATLFWDLRWGRYGEISGYEVSPETGDVVGATQVVKMEGFTDIAGTMTEGLLATPESSPTTLWPEP